MYNPLTLIPIGLLLLGLPATILAAGGNAFEGATKASTCMGCHGIPNYAQNYPSYRVPKLAGQNTAYLTVALKAYRSGQRQHATMQANAANLSDQDIADIAAYFSDK